VSSTNYQEAMKNVPFKGKNDLGRSVAIAVLLLGIPLPLAVLAVWFDPSLLCRSPIAKKRCKNCCVSSKPCLAIVAWMSRIFIVFENQIVSAGFATIAIACLFSRFGGYPSVSFFCVLFIAVYSFGVPFIVRLIREVFSSFTFGLVSFACLICEVVSSIVSFIYVLIITVYSFDVPFIAVYSFDVSFIVVYSIYAVVITVYSFVSFAKLSLRYAVTSGDRSQQESNHHIVS
jgi:hypothetical protein